MKGPLAQKITLISYFLFIISSINAFQFNSEGEFTILQFTDLHYGEDDTKDSKTQALQRKILDIVKPDLAVVSGDGVGGYAGYILHLFTNPGFFKKCWEKFTAPFVESNIPYAYTLGNHDAEADLNPSKIVELDKTNPLSVLKTAESIPGTANYRIPIYSSKDKTQLAANIWVFDTGNMGCDGVEDSWGCIGKDQIEWYNNQSEALKLKYGSNIHHIAFYHIPIPEYLNVYNDQQIAGISLDGIACPYHNTGFFDNVVKNGDISAMFIGHDHNNDFTGIYKGVEFVYGRKSGYGSYGGIFGARVIKLREVTENGKTIIKRDHYVIQEDGTIKITPTPDYRKGDKQTQCFPVRENLFLRLRYTGLYDWIGILLAIILVGIVTILIRRKMNRKPLKERASSVQSLEFNLLR